MNNSRSCDRCRRSMRLMPAQFAMIRFLAACLLLAWICPQAIFAQSGHQYPITQYQGFDQQKDAQQTFDQQGFDQPRWSTSSPQVADPGPNSFSGTSMSPDSWGVPSTEIQSSPLFAFDKSRPACEAPPSVPDLKPKSAFRSAGFVKKQEPIGQPTPAANEPAVDEPAIPLPYSANLKRYPLPNAAAKSVVVDNDFGSANDWYGYSPQEPPINFRPDLGHRSATPTLRHRGTSDDGDKYDFEDKKKEYPGIGEILATGRYFGSVEAHFIEPAFQANTAITTFAAGSITSTPFDFDYETAQKFRFGFESKFGPGFEINYWQYDDASDTASFTSDGATTGHVSSSIIGTGLPSELSAAGAGDTIDATHTIDVESIGATFFKEIKFPISRVNGMFGIHYVSIEQRLDATLSDGGGVNGTLNTRSDIQAFGPSFKLEYYRPVGHTKLELITTAGGSVLFGDRDEFVSNSTTGNLSRVNSEEVLTNIEFMSGVQYKKLFAENRAFYGRVGITYQTWLGGGTAVDSRDNFGLQGFSFAIGYNR